MISDSPRVSLRETERTLGLRSNLGQFSLLVLITAFVGGMVGIECSILPALAQEEFGLAERTAILSFIAVFGITKALANNFAGRLGDRWGRKPVLVAGWLVAPTSFRISMPERHRYSKAPTEGASP